MAIEIRGIGGNSALEAHVAGEMEAALGRMSVSPVEAEVVFFDENGPKGGIDTRCALTVRLPYRPPIRVEHVAEAPRLAFDRAFAALERQLARYVERARESRRRPKKYYVAKRLLGSEPGPPGPPAP
jgi:ribosome-associated translation inhibitor RaiA